MIGEYRCPVCGAKFGEYKTCQCDPLAMIGNLANRVDSLEVAVKPRPKAFAGDVVQQAADDRTKMEAFLAEVEKLQVPVMLTYAWDLAASDVAVRLSNFVYWLRDAIKGGGK